MRTMKTKISTYMILLFISIVMGLALLPGIAKAAEGDVTYRYYDTENKQWEIGTRAAGEYTMVETEDTGSPTGVELGGGGSEAPSWYVVSGEVFIGNASGNPDEENIGVTVTGDVRLILTENSTLWIWGLIDLPKDSRLTVYGTGTIGFDAGANTDGIVDGLIGGGNLEVHGGRLELSTMSESTPIYYKGVYADVTMYDGLLRVSGKDAVNSEGITGDVTMYGGEVDIAQVNGSYPGISGDVTMHGGAVNVRRINEDGKSIGGNVVCHGGKVFLDSPSVIGGTLTMDGGYVTLGRDMIVEGTGIPEGSQTIRVTGGMLQGYDPENGGIFENCVAGSGKKNEQGIKESMKVYGDAVLNYTVTTSTPITVPEGTSLTVPKDIKLGVSDNGKLINYGTVKGDGTLECGNKGLCTRGEDPQIYGTYELKADRKLSVRVAEGGIDALSVTLQPVTGEGEDGWAENPPKVEYAAVSADPANPGTVPAKPADDSDAWKTLPTDRKIEDLNSDTDYYFFARVKGGEIYKDAGYGDKAYVSSKIRTSKQVFEVKFDTKGGSEVTSQQITEREKAAKPEDPSREGFAFGGWYTDTACTDGNEWDFETSVTSALTLYAKWTDTSAPTGAITIKKGDTEEYSWKEFRKDIGFGIFFKDTRQVVIEATDDQSGIDKIEYLLAEQAITETDIQNKTDWTEYKEPFSIEQDRKYVVYAKLTNNDGLVTYISSDGMVMDQTAPTVSGIEDKKTYCGAVEVTVSDAHDISVTIEDVAGTGEAGIETAGTAVTVTDGKFTVIPKTGIWQKVVIADQAGNSRTYTIKVNDGHTWGEKPVWTWTDDNRKATATLVCAYDEHPEDLTDMTHKITASTEEISDETTPADCETDGKTVYEAAVTLGGNIYRDEKTEIIKATGHDWDQVDYSWSEAGDGYTCTAKHVCKNNSTHEETASGKVRVETIKEPTYTEKGMARYTADFDVIWAKTKTKEVELPLKEKPEEPSYCPIITQPEHGRVEIDNQNPKAGETVTIKPIPEEGYKVGEVTVTDKDGNKIEVTDHKDGTYSYIQPECEVTITVTFVKKEEPEKPHNHNWGVPEYTWVEAGDSYTCTAKRVCTEDSTHEETVSGKVRVETIKEPTYTEKGMARYTADFDVTWAETKTKEVELPLKEKPEELSYCPIITQPEHGRVEIDNQNPKAGEKVTIKPIPEEGYKVGEVTVTDKDGNKIEVTDHKDGTYSYIQPECEVTITVTFVKKDEPEKPKPDEPDKPGTDKPSGGTDKPGTDKPSGGTDQPGTDKPSGGTDKPGTDNSSNSVQTGDQNHIAVWFILLAVSCGTVMSVTGYRRRRR